MLIHAVLIVSEGQTSAEFVKIQMPEINSVVCVTGIFLMHLRQVHSLHNLLMQWHIDVTFWQDLSEPVKPGRSSFCLFP